jgi:Fe-S-cluster containining protein
MPIYYRCQRCGACCRWPGEVRLSNHDISRLAAFCGLSEYDFIQRYTRLRRDRTGLCLEDRADGSCVFLRGTECAVHAAKPAQCRQFLNQWNLPGFQAQCQAVACEVSPEEYAHLMSWDQSPLPASASTTSQQLG